MGRSRSDSNSFEKSTRRKNRGRLLLPTRHDVADPSVVLTRVAQPPTIRSTTNLGRILALVAVRSIGGSIERQTGGQDGLMLRNWIEITTKGDTSGRPLTLGEIFDVQDLGESRTKFKFSKDIIDDVNSKRPGAVLSPSDVSRAEKLEASRMAQADAKDMRANDGR